MSAAPPSMPIVAPWSGMLLPLVSLIAAMLSLQIGASIAKSLFPVIGAQGATALRLLLSAILLAAIYKPWRVRLRRDNWQAVTVYGASMAGMNFAFYMALETIPLGLAIALEFCGPMAVALLWSRRPVDFLWIGLAVVGLLLLLPIVDSQHTLDPTGVILALSAGVCWAIYIVVGKKAGEDHGSLAPVLGMIVAATLVFPFGLEHAGLDLFAPALLPAAIAVAVLSGALPYTLEMFSLRRMPPQTFGTLLSLEPALGALVGFLLLHESLPPIHIAAIVIVVLASIGAAITVKPQAPLHLPD